ncbi:histidine phosphatase family protein [Pontiellaceae bacterium B12227]|nr:histidine phosphatase family protein [Pontiellaceae bacterium B12227]
MPKTLYLVRHAKSDWNTGESDFERPLNKRGQRDAPEMGQRIKDAGSLPEQILCSPARRAVQTLESLDLGIKAVLFKEKIYEASTGDLLDLVQSLDDSCGSAMLIGHNPAMTWLATLLSGVRIEGMPTCSILTIRLDSDHWKSAGACPATLLHFDYPKKRP